MSRDDQDDPVAKAETEKPCVLCFPPKSAVCELKLPLLPIARVAESGGGVPFVK